MGILSFETNAYAIRGSYANHQYRSYLPLNVEAKNYVLYNVTATDDTILTVNIFIVDAVNGVELHEAPY